MFNDEKPKDDRFLEDLSFIDDLYRDVQEDIAQEQPSSALDQRILAAAHRQVNAKPELVNKAKLIKRPRWMAPMASAASILLVVTVGYYQITDPAAPLDVYKQENTVQSELKSLQKSKRPELVAKRSLLSQPSSMMDMDSSRQISAVADAQGLEAVDRQEYDQVFANDINHQSVEKPKKRKAKKAAYKLTKSKPKPKPKAKPRNKLEQPKPSMNVSSSTSEESFAMIENEQQASFSRVGKSEVTRSGLSSVSASAPTINAEAIVHTVQAKPEPLSTKVSALSDEKAPIKERLQKLSMSSDKVDAVVDLDRQLFSTLKGRGIIWRYEKTVGQFIYVNAMLNHVVTHYRCERRLCKVSNGIKPGDTMIEEQLLRVLSHD